MTTTRGSKTSTTRGSDGPLDKWKIRYWPLRALRILIILQYIAFLIILVWKLGNQVKKVFLPKTEFVDVPTLATRFSAGLIQSPSPYCSEFGRHMMINHDNIKAREVVGAVQYCLRFVHPHQASRFAFNAILELDQQTELCTSIYNKMYPSGNRIVKYRKDSEISEECASAMNGDGLSWLFWKKKRVANASEGGWVETSVGKSIRQEFAWWSFDYKRIPVSASLAGAIARNEKFLQSNLDLPYFVKLRRLVEGSVFEFLGTTQVQRPWMSPEASSAWFGFSSQKLREQTKQTSRGDRFGLCGLPTEVAASRQSSIAFSTLIDRYVASDLKKREMMFNINFHMHKISMEESIMKMWVNKSYLDEVIRDKSKTARESFSGAFPSLLFEDDGTALVSAVNQKGETALGITSLYSEFGSNVFMGGHALNNFMQLYQTEENISWLPSQNSHDVFRLPYSPMIVLQSRYGEKGMVYGGVARGSANYALVGSRQIVFQSAVDVESVIIGMKIPQVHLINVTQEEELHTEKKGFSFLALKNTYRFPKTVREDIITRLKASSSSTVSRQTLSTDDKQQALAFRYSVQAIAGVARVGDSAEPLFHSGF